MSQTIEGERANSQPDTAIESADSSAVAKERAKASDFYARATPEVGLVDLAIRLGGDLSPEQMLSEALAALTALLPDCCVEVKGRADGPQPSSATATALAMDSSLSATDALQSSVRSLGRCEWRLSDDPEGPVLFVSLRQLRQPRAVARVLDIGERVATLVCAALRREALRQRLTSQAEEILELQQRVIQSEKLASYGQLVASVLHDLNSPLTAILAYTEYLSRTLEASGVQPADMTRLSRIREAAETVMRQTRGLVEYSCPPRTPFVQVALASTIRRALFLCEHELSRAGVTVHSQFGSSLLAVNGHPEHLTQLFVNLLINAAHAACAQDARIDIDVLDQQDDQWLKVRIRDNGKGIQPSDIAHVFDPYYTTKAGSGCGLGLAIVQDIAEHHGGHISVESVPLVGTTFVLSLPVPGHSFEPATATTE